MKETIKDLQKLLGNPTERIGQEMIWEYQNNEVNFRIMTTGGAVYLELLLENDSVLLQDIKFPIHNAIRRRQYN